MSESNVAENDESYSVDLIYQITKESLQIQLQQRNSLETKANTLTAFAGGMFALMMGALDTLVNLPRLSQYFVMASVITFFFSIITCTFVSWVRHYWIYPNIEVLASKYIGSSEQEAELQLISNLSLNWKSNHNNLERNASLLRVAYICQTIAFITFGLALLLSVATR
jgi:hypothetical protein